MDEITLAKAEILESRAAARSNQTCYLSQQWLPGSGRVLVMHTHDGQSDPDWQQFDDTPAVYAEIEAWRQAFHESEG